MPYGVRVPSLRSRVAARTSASRLVRHSLGLKAPRGWGVVTDPKRAAYNRIYQRTTIPLAGRSGKAGGCGLVLLVLLALATLKTRSLPSPPPERTRRRGAGSSVSRSTSVRALGRFENSGSTACLDVKTQYPSPPGVRERFRPTGSSSSGWPCHRLSLPPPSSSVVVGKPPGLGSVRTVLGPREVERRPVVGLLLEA
jgi:hypothetical protein